MFLIITQLKDELVVAQVLDNWLNSLQPNSSRTENAQDRGGHGYISVVIILKYHLCMRKLFESWVSLLLTSGDNRKYIEDACRHILNIWRYIRFPTAQQWPSRNGGTQRWTRRIGVCQFFRDARGRIYIHCQQTIASIGSRCWTISTTICKKKQ